MRAYWSDEDQEAGVMPACSEELTFEEWAYLDFEIMPFPKEETEEGYNMILKHPKTDKLLFVRSRDFNFCHYHT